jgi:hypothetical protein
MTTINQLKNWHDKKLGLLLFTVIELSLTYGFGSLSIDRGLVWYLPTIIFLIGGLKNFFKLVGTLTHGWHKTS